jgi:O2-independent ubiquinone biosynthesis accessory factor UbiT
MTDAAPVVIASAPRRSAALTFLLPPIVRIIASRLPAYPPSVACAFVLSLVAPRLVGRDALAMLDGKAFRIVVRDAGAGVAFRVRSLRCEPLGGDRAVDVTFTACAADFLLLATRRADPDTLFFERRLLIEGDTETGLLLKNILDAIELPRWLSGT